MRAVLCAKLNIVFIFLSGMCFAEERIRTESFFICDEESCEILDSVYNRTSSKRKKPKTIEISPKISGIFYVDDENWTVWINDVPYSSIGQQEDFSIDSVSEHYVCLTLNDGSTLNLDITTDSKIKEDKKSEEII